MNIHRWRKLEGSDPAAYEMIQKIQTLQKRLILKTEEVVEKEILIQSKEKLYLELKNILARQPGPELAEQLNVYQHQLKEKTNWTDSDELALMFRNTYAPAFYKQLHRYVHKSYRKHIAIQQLKNLLRRPLNASFFTFKKALSFLYYAPAAWIDKQKLQSLENAPV